MLMGRSTECYGLHISKSFGWQVTDIEALAETSKTTPGFPCDQHVKSSKTREREPHFEQPTGQTARALGTLVRVGFRCWSHTCAFITSITSRLSEKHPPETCGALANMTYRQITARWQATRMTQYHIPRNRGFADLIFLAPLRNMSACVLCITKRNPPRSEKH